MLYVQHFMKVFLVISNCFIFQLRRENVITGFPISHSFFLFTKKKKPTKWKKADSIFLCDFWTWLINILSGRILHSLKGCVILEKCYFFRKFFWLPFWIFYEGVLVYYPQNMHWLYIQSIIWTKKRNKNKKMTSDDRLTLYEYMILKFEWSAALANQIIKNPCFGTEKSLEKKIQNPWNRFFSLKMWTSANLKKK